MHPGLTIRRGVGVRGALQSRNLDKDPGQADIWLMLASNTRLTGAIATIRGANLES